MMTVRYDEDPKGNLKSVVVDYGEKGSPEPQNLSLTDAINTSPYAYMAESVEFLIPKDILAARNEARQSY